MIKMKNKKYMKKTIMILLMLLICSAVYSQKVDLSMSAGYARVLIVKTDITYRNYPHNVISTLQVNATSKSKYNFGAVSLNYGYMFHKWMPYIGYSTEGISFGLNKYIKNNYVIGVGMIRNIPNITFGVTSKK